MPCLTMDPSNKVCPDYEADEWEIICQALVAGHQNKAELLTNEGAIIEQINSVSEQQTIFCS